MTDDEPTDRGSRDLAPWLLSGFGAVLAAFFAVWWAAFRPSVGPTAVGLGVLTVVVPALGLAWGGYHLHRSGIDPVRYGRTVRWTFGCALGFLLINLLVIAFFPWYSLAGNVVWAHFSLTSGAVGGFVVGYVEARAIQRAVDVAAATVRAEQLEAQREVLGYLNDLLRHEVLNSTQIIGGHADLLLSRDPETEAVRDRLETIQAESASLTVVIDDVRALLEANRHPESAAVDLSWLLEEAVAAVRETHPDAEVDVSTPESVTVSGNDGLRWLFSNLLENAIVHNEGDAARVEVSVETTPETAVVTVTDDGPGIDPEIRGRLFDRKSTNHGLGLYLARILANRYGGTLELAETGPEGTTFTATLPRASVDPVDRDGEDGPRDGEGGPGEVRDGSDDGEGGPGEGSSRRGDGTTDLEARPDGGTSTNRPT